MGPEAKRGEVRRRRRRCGGRRGALGVLERLAEDAVLEDPPLLVHLLRRGAARGAGRRRGAEREGGGRAGCCRPRVAGLGSHVVLAQLGGVGVEAPELLLDLVEVALDLLAVELCGAGREGARKGVIPRGRAEQGVRMRERANWPARGREARAGAAAGLRASEGGAL